MPTFVGPNTCLSNRYQHTGPFPPYCLVLSYRDNLIRHLGDSLIPNSDINPAALALIRRQSDDLAARGQYAPGEVVIRRQLKRRQSLRSSKGCQHALVGLRLAPRRIMGARAPSACPYRASDAAGLR